MAMRLRTLLGDHPGTAALKSGALKSDLVEFDFVDYSPTNKGFKPMVREAAFDVSEMAIVTYLMAKSFDKPMVLLPNVVVARFQHGHALYNAKRGTLKPADLNGKRVGIRSFTTTTGAWLRGILANDHGVDLNSIDWVTFEDAHVAEFKDTTKRAPAGKQIIQMLLDGELDAVLGEKVRACGLEAAVRRCRRGGEGVGCQAQDRADQPHGGGEPGAVREKSGRGAGSASPAGGVGQGVISRAAFHRRRDAPLAGTDHRLHRAAGAYPARVHRRRAVRRRDARVVIVGWAKAPAP